MSELTPEEKIAELKQRLKDAQAKTPEAPKAEVPKEDPKIPKLAEGGIIIDPPKPAMDPEEAKKEFTPPDPTAKLLQETPIHITWIDNRYHVNGIRGAPNGNKIIVRTLDDIEQLSNDLLVGLKNFNQPTMINTKKPRILPKKTCIYLNEEGKCTNEHYFDGIKKQYTTKDKTCLFANQDRCPQAD